MPVGRLATGIDWVVRVRVGIGDDLLRLRAEHASQQAGDVCV